VKVESDHEFKMDLQPPLLHLQALFAWALKQFYYPDLQL